MKDKEFSYTYTVYPEMARMYAKKGCKECHGRGIHKYQTPDKQESHSYCACVRKNIQKYK